MTLGALGTKGSGRGGAGEIFEPFEQFDPLLENAHAGLGPRTNGREESGQSTRRPAFREERRTRAWRGFHRGVPRLPKRSSRKLHLRQLSPAAWPRVRGPQILLVDDPADTLRTTATLLRKSGYKVITAQSVKKAEPLLDQT